MDLRDAGPGVTGGAVVGRGVDGSEFLGCAGTWAGVGERGCAGVVMAEVEFVWADEEVVVDIVAEFEGKGEESRSRVRYEGLYR